MPPPADHRCSGGKRDRDEREHPLRALAQKKPKPECTKHSGHHRYERAMYGTHTARNRTNSVYALARL